MQDLLHLFLLFSTVYTLLDLVYSDCQDELTYTDAVVNLEYELLNNSFLFKDNLTTSSSVFASCLNCDEWYKPDNTTVPIGSGGGIFRLSSVQGELRKIATCTSPNCQDGIYRCIEANKPILLGLYNDISTTLFQAKMSILFSEEDDYFSPFIPLYLNCITMNYPPTEVAWYKDDELITDIMYTSTMVDAPSSIYINHLIINGSTSTISGSYYCKANSSTVSQQINTFSEPKFVAGPPEILITRFPDQSSVYLEWKHAANSTTVYNQSVIYKDSMDAINKTVRQDCGISNNCTITNLTAYNNYTFVIAPSEGSDNVFQPTQPVEIELNEPGTVNVTSLNLFKDATKDGSAYNSLKASWLPFSTESAVSIATIGVCGDDSAVMCWTQSFSNIIGQTNISINKLSAGIPCSVSFVAQNVFGIGPKASFTVNQDKTFPISGKLMLTAAITNVTTSSVNITWSPLTCCEFSGEDPMYNVMITEATIGNETDLDMMMLNMYNDTVKEENNWYTFYNLEPDTLYNVTIIPVNSIGTGTEVVLRLVQTLSNQTTSSSSSTTTTAVASSSPTKGAPIVTVTPTTSQPLTLIIIISVIAVISIAVVIAIIVICTAVSYFIRSRKLRKESLMNGAGRNGDGLIELEIINDTVYQESSVLGAKHCAPYLIQFPTDTKATVGETVRFLVHAKGFPEPSLSWEYQGEPVTPVGPVQLFSDGTLILHNVEIQYSGRYTFVASNAAGTINRVVNLKVVEEGENEEDVEFEKMMNCRSVMIENKPIPVDLFEKYVETHHASDNDPFQTLFQSLLTYPERYSFIKANENNNKERNRYKNIIPYDDNIVELSPIPGWKNCQHTYINASYINGYNVPKKFIATQGPKTETITDFWRMVKQEQCSVIACLCNLHEANRVKCDRYWPETTNKPEEHGPYVVRLLSVELFSSFTVRSIEVLSSDGSQESQLVKQFHFTGWPDHGVPEHGSPFVLYHEKMLHYYRSSAVPFTPIIVHCSAGVGRTGTLIAYDIVMDQIREEGLIDCVGVVNQMREQRQKLIQTSQQLMFLHDVLLENTLCGSTIISMTKLSETLESLFTVSPQTEKTGFQTQFQLIQRLTPKPNKFKCTAAKKYIEKNRPNLPLPSDVRRVILYGQTQDYINASFIDGYQQKKAFIVAQSPMSQTMVDFWQMLIQQKVSIIVMLCEEVENSKVVCERYWPVSYEEAEVFGCYSVKLLRQQRVSETIVKRTLGVKDMNMGSSQVVTQIQFKHWLADGQCANHQSIGSLYTEITNSQQGVAMNPIAVHCSDSITRSAMYCATHMAIDQARLEHVIDVFQIVKNLRVQRPGSIPCDENYITIHDFVKEYLTKFETYQV